MRSTRGLRLCWPVLLLLVASPATALAEKSDLVLSLSSGTGAFISLVYSDAAPKLIDGGRFPFSFGISAAYEVGNEWGFSLGNGFLLEEGTAYFLKPAIIFYTHREYLSTFTCLGPAFFFEPAYYGGNLGLGGILRLHQHVEASLQADITSIFAGKGLSGKGMILSAGFSIGIGVRI